MSQPFSFSTLRCAISSVCGAARSYSLGPQGRIILDLSTTILNLKGDDYNPKILGGCTVSGRGSRALQMHFDLVG